MEKGDNRGILQGKDRQMYLGGGWNRKMRGLNSGEKFLARAGSRRRGSSVCASAMTAFSKSRWEATTALRIRVLGANWEELLVLLSVEVSSLPRNSLELYFICSSRCPRFIPALVQVVSWPWTRRTCPLHCCPACCGCVGTAIVHLFEFLTSSCNKASQPTSSVLCDILTHNCQPEWWFKSGQQQLFSSTGFPGTSIS